MRSYAFKNDEAAIIYIEAESAHGAHERIYSSVYFDTTNRISHAPFISFNHLIKSTMHLLEWYGLKQIGDFKLPSKSWASLKFMSNNG